jgi:hypothetical protein
MSDRFATSQCQAYAGGNNDTIRSKERAYIMMVIDSPAVFGEQRLDASAILESELGGAGHGDG